MDFLDKLARLRAEGDGAPLPDDQEARTNYPVLWELLTCRTCLDDQARVPARVTISVGMGCWTIGLFDETLAISVEATSAVLGTAFLALESKLGDLSAWRVNKRRKPKLRPVADPPAKNGLKKRRS